MRTKVGKTRITLGNHIYGIKPTRRLDTKSKLLQKIRPLLVIRLPSSRNFPRLMDPWAIGQFTKLPWSLLLRLALTPSRSLPPSLITSVTELSKQYLQVFKISNHDSRICTTDKIHSLKHSKRLMLINHELSTKNHLLKTLH